MTTAEEAPSPLFHSPIGLWPFQAEATCFAAGRDDSLLGLDTGMGKGVIALARTALHFEDDEIDIALLFCKGIQKLDEWMEDIAHFTDLEAGLYYGTSSKRRRILAEGAPKILVSTYETFRNDLVTKERYRDAKGKLHTRWVPGVLLEWLSDKRVLVVWDEMAKKLSERTSVNYKANEALLKHMRKISTVKTCGLTATPMDKDPESYFNVGRLLAPDAMPTVAQFERDYVVWRTPWGAVGKAKNLEPDFCDAGVTPLSVRLAPILWRASKSDPEIARYFPHQIEEFPPVTLGPKHHDFYVAVEEAIADEADEDDSGPIFDGSSTVMRQIAAHPLSLTLSKGKLARKIVAEVGRAGLEALGSAKLDRLVDDLDTIVKTQGDQAIVFTFFGQSVLPLIHERLSDEGFEVDINHGGMKPADQIESRKRFRAGKTRVFLTSDAGAEGVNLPEAAYVVNYEPPTTPSIYIQRIGRNDRIDSTLSTIFARTYVALDTSDEEIFYTVLRRNEWSDALMGQGGAGSGRLTAQERREIFKLARAAHRAGQGS